jgi:hypothetical protein
MKLFSSVKITDVKFPSVIPLVFADFLVVFCPSTLSCSIIELYDFIQFSFEYSHPGIITRSENLHLNLGGLELSFFFIFF